MRAPISQAELDVLEVLWRESPLSAADIGARLGDTKDWSAQTVKTLLARLVEKGAIAHQPDGRRYLYRPLVQREAYARRAAKNFVDRLFGGRAAPLVAHLAESGELSREDIKELEALIRELKRDAR